MVLHFLGCPALSPRESAGHSPPPHTHTLALLISNKGTTVRRRGAARASASTTQFTPPGSSGDAGPGSARPRAPAHTPAQHTHIVASPMPHFFLPFSLRVQVSRGDALRSSRLRTTQVAYVPEHLYLCPASILQLPSPLSAPHAGQPTENGELIRCGKDQIATGFSQIGSC